MYACMEAHVAVHAWSVLCAEESCLFEGVIVSILLGGI